MTSTNDQTGAAAASKKADACAEHGKWTSAPDQPASLAPLDLATIDPEENARITATGVMTFSMAGCSGDPDTSAHTTAVATAITDAGDSSFFYHLRDITYTEAEKGSGSSADDSTGDDERRLWNAQFYKPYTGFPKRIVAIAGNHDGKLSNDQKKSQLTNYVENFCASPSTWPQPWTHNSTDKRP